MSPLSLVLGLTNTLTATVLIAISIPLLRGRVGPNKTYGFRFPQAFASDEAWFAINHYGAQRLIFWCAPLLLLGIATFFVSLEKNLPATLATANAPLIVLAPFLETRRYAKRYGAAGPSR